MTEVLQEMGKLFYKIFIEDWQSVLIMFALLAGMMGILFSIIYFMDTKNRKFRKELVVGDNIGFSSQMAFKGEILELNEKNVVVKTTIPKGIIYKPRKNK